MKVSASLPASPPDVFGNYGAVTNQHIHKGTLSISSPIYEISRESVPHLAHLKAILNGASLPQGLAKSGNEFYGKLAMLVAGGLMHGAEIGSGIVKNGMEVGSDGVKSLNNNFESRTKAGINMGGNMAGLAIGAGSMGADISASGMKSLESESAEVAKRVLDYLKGIRADLELEMESARKTVTTMLDDGRAVLENGDMTFTSKENESVYEAVQEYLVELGEIDMLMKTLSASLNIKGFSHPVESSISKSFSTIPLGTKLA